MWARLMSTDSQDTNTCLLYTVSFECLQQKTRPTDFHCCFICIGICTILFKTRVRHVLSYFIQMVMKTIGKPVTVWKLFKNAVKCRQAECCSSIRLDFRAKWVKVFTLNNADKIDNNFCAKFWHDFFTFLHLTVTGA